ncbi:hypothetical protein [Nonomuraea sp. 10N515B]|uniref:hypothetical protein n=1 Tax=Nonomuraea sp. 10N515B TaxID=3457422 RepID=UPI003FCE5C13
MSAPTHQPGEHVRVTIEGRIQFANDTGITLRQDDLLFPIAYAPTVKITRVAPADGEPQPGQIWADAHGTEWYAARRTSGRGESRVYLYAPDGRDYHWSDVHTDDQLGPIRLVRPANPVPAVPQHETAVL